jgi:hypothetical protein
MRIGCGVHHGFRQGRGGRSAGLGDCWSVGWGTRRKGRGWWRRRSGRVAVRSGSRTRQVVAAVAGDWGFWYSLDVCRSAASASMAGVSTTGSHRRARDAETGVRHAPFAFGNFSRAESVGSASIRVVRAGRIRRRLTKHGRSISTLDGWCTGSGESYGDVHVAAPRPRG